jgi:hypothetical protein
MQTMRYLYFKKKFGWITHLSNLKKKNKDLGGHASSNA